MPHLPRAHSSAIISIANPRGTPFKILEVLEEADEFVYIRKLATAVGIHKGQPKKILDFLIIAGYVEQHPFNKEWYGITSAGRTAFLAAKAAAEEEKENA